MVDVDGWFLILLGPELIPLIHGRPFLVILSSLFMQQLHWILIIHFLSIKKDFDLLLPAGSSNLFKFILPGIL